MKLIYLLYLTRLFALKRHLRKIAENRAGLIAPLRNFPTPSGPLRIQPKQTKRPQLPDQAIRNLWALFVERLLTAGIPAGEERLLHGGYCNQA